ncbi:MAG: hypothetical protein KGL39_09300 [Patescibacteria group bacterium]|nr:hypothetical protein [Patescibacteria group bacterium]
MGDCAYSDGYSAGSNLTTDDSPFEDNGANGEPVFPAEPVYAAKGKKGVKFEWLEREDVRAPLRPKERTLKQFISPENIKYLRGLFERTAPAGPPRKFVLDTLTDAVYEFQHRANDMLESDTLAMRGENRPASGMWDEVKRLNTAFYADRMKVLREQASNISQSQPRKGPRDILDDEDEDFAYRMFTADSLRPPGLEHLNSAGPLYALLEDQGDDVHGPSDKRGVDYVNDRKERFSSKREPRESKRDFMAPEDDVYAWFYEGNANRTPEQAIEEYRGADEGYVEDKNLKPVSKTALGIQELATKTDGQKRAWGNNWVHGTGTRFMRYERPMFWQDGRGRDGYDRDIEETLGTAGRELDNDVRKWNIERATSKKGETYRRYGPRSGYVV